MATELIETIPFTFSEIYTDLEAKFAAKGYDALYEGSNTAQLVTAMSYLVSMLNANTATNVNEMLLPLAQKRNNILYDARLLGYEVNHVVSYRYRLTLTFAAGNYSIPKYSEFNSNGKSYYLMEKDIILTNVLDGHSIDVEVVEGTLYKFSDYPDSLKITTTTILNDYGQLVPQYYVDIPYKNVEEDGIECYLTYYDQVGVLHKQEEWTKADKILLEKDSFLPYQFARMDNIEMSTPRIYFKIAGMGTTLRKGTIIELNVLTSSGVDGEADTEAFTTSLNCTITNAKLLIQGANEEDTQSIKENAPLFYNSANRAVTRSDFLAICNRENSVDKVEVWGGEDEHPEAPGHIWFCFTPSTYVRAFTNDDQNINYTFTNPESEQNNFIEDEELVTTNYDENNTPIKPGVFDVVKKYAIPTMTYHNRHHMMLEFIYTVSIKKYNIVTSKADINQAVFNIIDTYFKEEVENFWFEYFNSNLMRKIDSYLTDASGFELTLKNRFMISRKSIVYENPLDALDGKVMIHLSIPYEPLFANDGSLITNNLPSIEHNFITAPLVMDYSLLVGDEISTSRIEIPITQNSVVVGKYTIFNSFKKYILIELYVKEGFIDPVFFDSTNETQYLDITFPSPNMKMFKNVVPRLKSVTFN